MVTGWEQFAHVFRWPYDYSKPGAKEDFIPQSTPYSETPESNLPFEEKLANLERQQTQEGIKIQKTPTAKTSEFPASPTHPTSKTDDDTTDLDDDNENKQL